MEVARFAPHPSRPALKVLDLFSGAQAHPADSASGREGRGTSGRVSRLSPSSCSDWNATRHCGDVLACERYQVLGFLRTPDTREARLGGENRTGSDFHPAHASLRRERNKPPSSLGFSRRTSTDCRGRCALSIPTNNANGWHRLVIAPQSLRRTGDSGASSSLQPSVAASGTWSCIQLSTTWRSLGLAGIRSRKIRSVSGVWS